MNEIDKLKLRIAELEKKLETSVLIPETMQEAAVRLAARATEVYLLPEQVQSEGDVSQGIVTTDDGRVYEKWRKEVVVKFVELYQTEISPWTPLSPQTTSPGTERLKPFPGIKWPEF